MDGINYLLRKLLGILVFAQRAGYAYWQVFGTCLFVVWTRFLYTFFPEVQKRVIESRKSKRPERMWEPMKSESDWGKNFFGSTDIIKERYKAYMQDVYLEARLNAVAPNPVVTSARSGEEVNLLSKMKKNRPLILNFGSCTWPPFMAALERFSQMVEKFSSAADFMCVYIAEAHPAELKHFGGNYDISTHRGLEDRMAAASIFLGEYDDLLRKKFPTLEDVEIPVVVDSMTDEANKKYAALPERLFGIIEGKVGYVGDVGPIGYDIDAVEEWIQKVT